MPVETLRYLSWRPMPKPPIGPRPVRYGNTWLRYTLAWYLSFKPRQLWWRFQTWRWRRRTGGKMELELYCPGWCGPIVNFKPASAMTITVRAYHIVEPNP